MLFLMYPFGNILACLCESQKTFVISFFLRRPTPGPSASPPSFQVNHSAGEKITKKRRAHFCRGLKKSARFAEELNNIDTPVSRLAGESKYNFRGRRSREQ